MATNSTVPRLRRRSYDTFVTHLTNFPYSPFGLFNLSRRYVYSAAAGCNAEWTRKDGEISRSFAGMMDSRVKFIQCHTGKTCFCELIPHKSPNFTARAA
ncbi:hypothetical protein A0H81_13564 [Grifola frondosa]|uniref:Uncharacterized protein n=1 Tax=Grifola frondosa TaxID=5627 RepID=A0A1C7LNN8_GRIFR|nr:hypothetical protein A0H81_13564 [Grifola frondosa]